MNLNLYDSRYSIRLLRSVFDETESLDSHSYSILEEKRASYIFLNLEDFISIWDEQSR